MSDLPLRIKVRDGRFVRPASGRLHLLSLRPPGDQRLLHEGEDHVDHQHEGGEDHDPCEHTCRLEVPLGQRDQVPKPWPRRRGIPRSSCRRWRSPPRRAATTGSSLLPPGCRRGAAVRAGWHRHLPADFQIPLPVKLGCFPVLIAKGPAKSGLSALSLPFHVMKLIAREL